MKPRLGLALVLAAASSLSLVVGHGSIVRAADPSSDIPGVPMPGPVATGLLGGPVYDVVYRLSVPPATIVVASLTGTTATDFDLYAFDGSATTVEANTGLLAKSIGPTSTESLTFPSAQGGTYYIDLNGSTDVEGTFTLVVSMVADPTPPTLTLRLAPDRAAVNMLTVPVELSASDDLSGIVSMAFSTDGVSYGLWQPFATSTTWAFPSGDGVRTLWARVLNGVGLVSAPAQASVIIDTLPPVVTGIDPMPGPPVIGLRPRVTVAFDEPIAGESWAQTGFILQAANGQLVTGSYAYDDARRVGTFTPTTDLQAGATYVATVGSVTDVAGNPVTPIGSWTLIPLSATSIAVTAVPATLTIGGSSTLGIDLVGAPERSTVDVSARRGNSGDFATLASLPAHDGHATLVVTPDAITTYRLSYAGTSSVAPASAEARVLVRRGVSLLGLDAKAPRLARVGRPVTLTAAIAPPDAGVSVSFRLYRYDVSRGAWVYAGSRGRATDPLGRASLRWTPTSNGSFYWRVTVGSTADYANNVSPVYRYVVGR